MITDTAADRVEGGFSKISSVQNVVLFSADLHGPWGNYQFGVDPDVCGFLRPLCFPFDGCSLVSLRMITESRPLSQALMGLSVAHCYSITSQTRRHDR